MLFIITLLLAFGFTQFGPWWLIAPAAFTAAIFFGKNYRQSFWSGFLAILVVWVAIALFKTVPNNNILATRVAKMLFLPHWSLLLLVTGLIGGIVGGLSAVCGHQAKKTFARTPAN